MVSVESRATRMSKYTEQNLLAAIEIPTQKRTVLDAGNHNRDQFDTDRVQF